MIAQVASLVATCTDPDGMAVLAYLSRYIRRAERLGLRVAFVSDKQVAEEGGYRRAGDGRVFQCVYFLIDGQPEKSTWILGFYEYLVYAARTGYPSMATSDNAGAEP